MASMRVSRSARRMCHQYQLFFFIAFLLVGIQLYLAWSFYSINQMEMDELQIFKERIKRLEMHDKIVHQSLDLSEQRNQEDVVKPKNGDGAAEGVNVIEHPKDVKSALHRMNQDKENKERRANNMTGLQQAAKELFTKCNNLNKEAQSAISRAQTMKCKQDIMDIACKQQAGTVYPSHIPRSCPLKEDNYGQYIGCFRDDRQERILSGHNSEFKDNNTPMKCVDHCLRAGFRYAGVQFSYECWCGSQLALEKKLSEGKCDSVCAGNKTVFCGGYLAVNIYHTGYGKAPANHAGYVQPNLMSPDWHKVRIAFVLTVNGRALRQLKRLFKALYHQDHYYYIHVDERQEYLHRELKRVVEGFDNVHVTDWRLATIWGGASLLTMHLHCMRELFAFKHWKWDYFVNLSESDYPIKPVQDLVTFLSKHNEKNFVRSHGKDTVRFMQKQGLDRTFYECENHMWRLGTRQLPGGIRIDGGSDWIVLHRDFCHYVLNGNDELLNKLHMYWQYTLLPSESFFHTVLANSKFCTTYVNNNLHLTNWNRKKGCKCQYKHIVDWCGCSPNDYLTSDLPKILNTENYPVYFARKFEAIINQEVINRLDTHMFGSYAEDTEGLLSYWQNEYHHEDVKTKTDDTFITFYNSFARLGTKQVHDFRGEAGCAFKPAKILETTVYSYADMIQGLLVKYTAQHSTDETNVTLESYVQPQKKYKIVRPVGPINRLKLLEVGTNFDPKEEIFRNYGGLFGPYSDLSLGHAWGAGQQFTATVIWVDPANTIAAAYEIPIKDTDYIETSSAVLNKPLRPGLWRVQLVYLWEVAAEVEFAVTPLSHYGGRPITPDEARLLHMGPAAGKYVDRDLSQYNTQLQLKDTEKMQEEASENANKTGEELLEWIDQLTLDMWHISDTCIDKSEHSTCGRLPLCQKTAWSSLSLDPKSFVGHVNPSTGRLR